MPKDSDLNPATYFEKGEDQANMDSTKIVDYPAVKDSTMCLDANASSK